MSEKIICEKCGTEMQSHHKGSTCSMLCPKCGWGWVMTYPANSASKRKARIDEFAPDDASRKQIVRLSRKQFTLKDLMAMLFGMTRKGISSNERFA